MFVNDLGISDSIGIPFSAALVNHLYAIIVKSHQQRKIAMCTKGNEGLVEEDKSKGHFLLFFGPKKRSFSILQKLPRNDFIKKSQCYCLLVGSVWILLCLEEMRWGDSYNHQISFRLYKIVWSCLLHF